MTMPLLYQKLYESMKDKFYPRQMIGVGEFKHLASSKYNVPKNEWFGVVKDFEGYGVMKREKNKLSVDWNN